tara:strand:- start:1012 stop:1188 length:177 start_codon:yes stop_codon:yes gene_type:complete
MGGKMKMNYKNRKKGKMFEEVANVILESPDCKCEIIWLLKKQFKDEDELKYYYSDLLS